MGALNEAPIFLAMGMKLQMEWGTLSKERGLKNVASKIIVDDMLLYGCTADQIRDYFGIVMYVLKH